MPHTVDAVFHLFVSVDRRTPCKILIALHRGKGVITAELRVFCLSNQSTQHCFLQCLSLVLMLLQLQLLHLVFQEGDIHGFSTGKELIC